MACVQTGINAAGPVVRHKSWGLEKNYFSGLEFWPEEVRAIKSCDLYGLILEDNISIYCAPGKPWHNGSSLYVCYSSQRPFSKSYTWWLPFFGMWYLSMRHLSKWVSGRRQVTCPTNVQKGRNRTKEEKRKAAFFLPSGLGQTDRHNKMCGCHLAGVNRSDKLQYTSLVVLNCLHASDFTIPYADLLPQSFIERINATKTWPLWTFASRLPSW